MSSGGTEAGQDRTRRGSGESGTAGYTTRRDARWDDCEGPHRQSTHSGTSARGPQRGEGHKGEMAVHSSAHREGITNVSLYIRARMYLLISHPWQCEKSVSKGKARERRSELSEDSGSCASVHGNRGSDDIQQRPTGSNSPTGNDLKQIIDGERLEIDQRQCVQ